MDRQRGIDGELALRHRVDGAPDGGAGEIHRREALHRREPQQRPRILARLEHPAQHELVDVRELVVAGGDHGVRRGERRDVAGDAHAEAVGLLHHGRHPGWIDAVVDLDLPVAARAIPAYRVERGGLAVHDDAVVGVERALALDESAARDARPGDGPGLDAGDQPVEHLVGVAHVADRGRAAEQVEQRVFLIEMGVHLEHPRHQRAVAAVNRHLARRGGTRERFDAGDGAAADDDGDRLGQRLRHGIEEPDVRDPDRRSVAMRRRLLDRGQPIRRHASPRAPAGGRLPSRSRYGRSRTPAR